MLKKIISLFFSLVVICSAGNAQLVTLPTPQQNTQTSSPDEFNFGSISQTGETKKSHTFVLLNKTSSTITIDSILTSCGCTSASLENSRSLPIVLQSQEKVSINTTVDLTRLTPGEFDKTIFVQSKNTLLATLHVTGNIVPGVIFVKSSIDFGQIAYGDQPEKQLDGILSSGIITTPDQLEVFSSDPSIQASISLGEKTSQGKQALLLKAKITQKPYIGALSGIITIGEKDSSGNIRILGSQIRISGEIVGSISASPLSVELIQKEGEKIISKDVLISGIDPKNLLQIKTLSVSPLITAQLSAISLSQESSVKIARLHLSISDKMHVGSLQTQVIITMPNGEQLKIPVFAQINK